LKSFYDEEIILQEKKKDKGKEKGERVVPLSQKKEAFC